MATLKQLTSIAFKELVKAKALPVAVAPSDVAPAMVRLPTNTNGAALRVSYFLSRAAQYFPPSSSPSARRNVLLGYAAGWLLSGASNAALNALGWTPSALPGVEIAEVATGADFRSTDSEDIRAVIDKGVATINRVAGGDIEARSDATRLNALSVSKYPSDSRNSGPIPAIIGLVAGVAVIGGLMYLSPVTLPAIAAYGASRMRMNKGGQ